MLIAMTNTTGADAHQHFPGLRILQRQLIANKPLPRLMQYRTPDLHGDWIIATRFSIRRMAAAMTPPELASKIDHTLLKPEATAPEIHRLIAEAIEHRFVAVCIAPVF